MPAQEMSMAVNIPPNAPPHMYAAAAEQCLEWGRPDTALKVSELGLSRHPSYYGLRLFRAEALLQHNRPDKAEEDLRAVLAAEPQHPRAIKILAHVLLNQRRYKDAIPILERAEFILVGDTDIPEWLKAAERAIEEEAKAPTPPASFLYREDAIDRIKDLATVPGVLAVSARDEFDERIAGPKADDFRLQLDRLGGLERRMSEVMADAAFGRLMDVTVQDAEVTWTSHIGDQATLRVAAEPRVREGLMAWHCKKVLGEVSE